VSGAGWSPERITVMHPSSPAPEDNNVAAGRGMIRQATTSMPDLDGFELIEPAYAGVGRLA
jgi:hypothetical protein